MYFKWAPVANFQLIAAMNPCPCGWLNDPQKACGCVPAVVTKYQKRISGPLLDRIEVPRVDYEKLSSDRMGRPASRFASVCRRHAIFNNNALPVRSPTSSVMPICALGRYGSSASYKTADLIGSEEIQSVHLTEALQYRPMLMAE